MRYNSEHEFDTLCSTVVNNNDDDDDDDDDGDGDELIRYNISTTVVILLRHKL